MKVAKSIAITLAFVLVFALGIQMRDSRTQLVPVAHASDDPPLFERGCDIHSLFGSYGISTTGFIVSAGPVGPVGDVGVITFDGQGNVVQTSTVSLNGAITAGRMSAGTYIMNPDCTGTITAHLPPPAGLSQSNFVVVDKGKELQLINTGNGRVLVGNARKQ